MATIILTGTLTYLSQEQTLKSGKQFREFLMRTHEEHPQTQMIQLFGDKKDMLNQVPIGTTITAHINLNGYEYKEGKAINSLTLWKYKAELQTPNTNANPF